MIKAYIWLSGWYATKLHAYPENAPLPEGKMAMPAICGNYVYGKPVTAWAQRRFDKGLPYCKLCERALAKGETK